MKVKKATDKCKDCGKTLLKCTCQDLAPRGADATYERQKELKEGQ